MEPIHPREPARLPLAMLPTPVVELSNLARVLGVQQVRMKRDDLTGVEFTGNKIRKLEYLLADARAGGCDTIVTHGGFQSNHCRATAAAGARLGMRVRLILRSPSPAPENDGNLLLDRLFGAEISLHAPEEYAERRQELIDAAMSAERAAGRKPYFFPVGGSVPLGCWGYIRCVHELVAQLGRETSVDLFVPVSSSGTHAGVMLGLALFASGRWRAIGVPVSDSVEFFRNDLRRLERETTARFGLGLTEQQTPIELLDGFIGQGYAIPTPESIEAINLLARTEGVLLDPTYTSKAMAGFLDAVRSGGIRRGALPVFLHTGGIFGLLARRELFA